MRQYEKNDCIVQTVQEGQELTVGEAYIPANMSGECDLVLVFGDPNTKETIYVPYNSKIEIGGRIYQVLMGKIVVSRTGKRLGLAMDHSIDCLLDEKGNLNSMEKFEHKRVKVVELPKSKFRKILQDLFNRVNNE